jgi:hypothetical protein
MTALSMAIERGKYKKQLHCDKLGQAFVIAYDERKRMLAVCATDASKVSISVKDLAQYSLFVSPLQSAVQLHIFVFDETFLSLRGQGNSSNLLGWYDELPEIQHMCFVSGIEELALVESSGRARIFSLITQQFRSGTRSYYSYAIVIEYIPAQACQSSITRSSFSRLFLSGWCMPAHPVST